jgi:hypothetical protein
MPAQLPNSSEAARRYRWPWFLLGAILLAIVLAVLWLSREIERTRRLRDWNSPASPQSTNTLR